MLILGIDPGTAIMGYGLIEKKGSRLLAVDYGCWRTPAHTPMTERLLMLYNDIAACIKNHQPNFVAVEELFFNRNTTTAISVGQARGVILLAAAQAGIPVSEYTPLQVKQSVTGYGRADKQQIQQMVKALLGLPEIPKPDDTADALAIAICHAHSVNLLNRMGGSL
ncbi:Holliday junction endonuclease RuvC [Desulfitobacterium dichloroeliminans LMG P-21439]|uniref:Crossover junction endodeoxyribonuclease RuvC n=1 Tax=Desulfitobacterium dichloroeliminans (strain LMG P-21439 / DCA1) TaxID=871963 RepID=L0FA94_DESDL|nr:crossover junction endodeoxyribonuclease RuvC [Desulfitobacterium dichloroeliminans]AGA69950.1 Holliday junction endonuclease RuvC [Desulfitobacterium dichloroeliminans LMG P-21439]